MSRKAKNVVNIAAIAVTLGLLVGLAVSACGGGFPAEIETIQQGADACTCDVVLPAAAPIPIAPAEGWIAHYGLSYWRDPLGVVHVQGSVSSANGLDVPVITLPAGYRPPSYRAFSASEVYPGYSGTARIEINPDGTVSVTPIRTSAVISLDGIAFLAMQ